MFLNMPYEEIVKKENKLHKPRVILVGYGWGSKGFLNNIDKNKYDVTLISKDDTFSFTPGLHHFLNYPELLNKDMLTSNANNERETKFIHAQVNNVDFYSNIVQFNERKEHDYSRDVEYSKEYDFIIFSHGTDINTYGIKGIKEHSYSVKTFDDICNLRQKLNELNNEARIVVMGCGPLGIELLGSIMDYKNANNKNFEILGLDAMERPLSMFHVDQSKEAINHFSDNNVNLYMNRIVKMIDSDIIHIKNGDYFKPGQYGYDDGYDLRYDLAIWCGGVKNAILTNTLFDGQLIVNDMFNIIKNVKIGENKNENENEVSNIENSIIKNAYAIGDCVQYIEKCLDRGNNMEPRELIRYPKTGQVAYQQGEYLAQQFNNNFADKEPFKFKNRGQFCYIGNGKSLYYHTAIFSGGYLAGIMNNIALAYNLWKI